MKNYDQRLRPVRNSNRPLRVALWIELLSLMDVDSTKEHVRMQLLIFQSWRDEFLTWHPADWNNITGLSLPVSDIWIPDDQFPWRSELLQAALAVSQPRSSTRRRPLLTRMGLLMSPSTRCGNTSGTDLQMVTVKCHFNVARFPFDTQNCSLPYGSTTYTQRQITHEVNESQMTSIVSNNWRILVHLFF